jgi:thiol-disulfide isomerase/thioredoxin
VIIIHHHHDSSRMGGSVRDVKSKAELDEAVSGGSPVALHFWASWCEASKHMDQLFSHLATDFPHTHFLRVSFLS